MYEVLSRQVDAAGIIHIRLRVGDYIADPMFFAEPTPEDLEYAAQQFLTMMQLQEQANVAPDPE